MDKIKELQLLNEKILQCNKCKLNKLRGFGYGNPNSKIMFLAQNPGSQPKDSTTKSEEIIPFSLDVEKGEASGRYFRMFLDEFGLTNNDFYITNIIKCPREDSNDPPTDEEVENCRDFFHDEFELQEPELIVGLGSPSQKYMKIESNGKLEKRGDTYLIALWHPGYISRSSSFFDQWIKKAEPIRSIIKKIKAETTNPKKQEVPVPVEKPKEEILVEKPKEEIKPEFVGEQFVHLHLHDEFSLLDGFSKVEDYAAETKRRGWKYLAVTNHGMMGQIPRQYKICQSLGITPVYGCEVYVNDNIEYRNYMTKEGEGLPLPEKYTSLEDLREKFKKNYHIVLIAKNEIGFKNLLKITSHAWINGYYRRPRTTHKFIQDHSEGLICGSACMAGPVSSCILKDQLDKAYQFAEFYQSMFGEDFYLEIMFLEMEEQIKINKQLLKIAKDLKIDLVLTNDCHYLQKDDSFYQDILLLMQNGNTIKDLEDTSKDIFQFGSKNLWYKTAEELDDSWKTNHSYIPEEEYKKMKSNTIKFAEKCKVSIDTTLKIPVFDKFSLDTPDEFKTSTDIYLRYLGFEGLKRRKLNEKKEYIDRIEMELEVVKKKEFASYFLIVNDLIEFAKASKISVGPGRGCFVPETLIMMADNSLKQIKDIQIGDIVKNQYGNTVVETKFEYDVDEDLIELEFDGFTIKCTKDHKFITKEGEIEAQYLTEDSEILEI